MVLELMLFRGLPMSFLLLIFFELKFTEWQYIFVYALTIILWRFGCNSSPRLPRMYAWHICSLKENGAWMSDQYQMSTLYIKKVERFLQSNRENSRLLENGESKVKCVTKFGFLK